MGNALVTNNAVGTLASSMSDSVLTAVLNSGQGALFPNPVGDQYFYVTLVDASNNKEIVKVTARSLNTLTIVRAQDNTTARAFDAGDFASQGQFEYDGVQAVSGRARECVLLGGWQFRLCGIGRD